MRQARIECNGEPADADLLRVAALANYGHFTSMQVRGGAVRGLDLHLARLDSATRELFGCALDLAAVREWMRRPLADCAESLSMRVQVFSRAFDRDRPERVAAPDVLVATLPAREIAPRPLRLRSVRYQREAPHLKHVGTFGLFHQRRLARQDGFDDALFLTAEGDVSEATVWNIGFVVGGAIVWPDAPMLAGVTMRLLAAGLAACDAPARRRRIAHADLARFDGAFLTNASCTALPVQSIDDIRYSTAAVPLDLLQQAMASQRPQPI